MLDMQRELQEKTYGFGPLEELDDQARMEWVRNNVLALTDELHEALAESGWKPWATSNHLNREAFASELVDAWHFFMNLMLICGMDMEDLARGYERKRQVNILRQQLSYDGVSTKCRGCGRALDDEAVECTSELCHFPGAAK